VEAGQPRAKHSKNNHQPLPLASQALAVFLRLNIMQLRDYQQRTLDELYAWWVQRPNENPLVTVPTGGGKSVIIAELCRLLFDTWPEDHPRTVVLVPSKELAEQNAAKLKAMLPSKLKVGYYSAALGKKQPDADVIVATIGSIANAAHLLGNIKCVVIDEAHLCNPDGREAGRYRKFLTDLAKYCQFRVVGWTATPFRGNGIWLTEGDEPLFHGMASRVTVQELLAEKHLAPLIRPVDAISTRIDTAGIGTSSGDFNLDELSERVDGYLSLAAEEACTLAADRKKWIAFTPTVLNANHLADLLNARGILSAVVCGDTPKADRERLIAEFRSGKLRCLVTVLALATGFDVPDVDCILWLRPTQSPVLYVQGAGRGLRPAEGKENCLWLDFSDTTERMGPVDTIKGRSRPKKKDKEQGAPKRTCPECGEQCAAALTACPTCGFEFPVNEKEARKASNAAVMSSQIQPRINTYELTAVKYGLHQKEGKPDSIRVDYWSGLRCVASDWLCFDHGGFATGKAINWFNQRKPDSWGLYAEPVEAQGRVSAFLLEYMDHMRKPSHITINEQGKFPEIVSFKWEEPNEPARTESHNPSPTPVPATV
jgi:DNA repair protein RadD